jgi:hypothetical protein
MNRVKTGVCGGMYSCVIGLTCVFKKIELPPYFLTLTRFAKKLAFLSGKSLKTQGLANEVTH